MPAPHDTKLPLRLAYSHREKAEVAVRQCDRSLRDGGLDNDHHAKLRAGYEREAQLAQRTIQRLLGVERARMETLEAQRRAALEEQLHLAERVAAGRLTPQAANDTNRRLARRVEDIAGEIDVCRQRLEARTSEELGGFIDLSFPEYHAEETKKIESAARAETSRNIRLRDWYYASLLAVIAAVAVFLPWYSSGGVTSSLATSEGGLSHLALSIGLPPALSRFAWVYYAVLPFAGVLMTAWRRVHASGWGFLLLGLVMLASAALPGLALSTENANVTNILALLASFRIGAMLYGASALGFVVLGALRVSPPDDTLRHATAVSLALLAALAAFGLFAALALFGMQSIPKVSFLAAVDSAAKDRVAFTISNNGRDPITCYFPLPADRNQIQPTERTANTFGMRVDVMEKGRDTYSATPPSPGLWNVAQGPLPDDQKVIVNAGTQLKGNLDLRQLSALGVEPSSVRIQLASYDGSLVDETEISLDDRYLSKPGPIRDPLIIPPPPSKPSGALSIPKSAPQPVTPAPAPAPADTVKVEFTGAIGGRAIIHVFSPEGSAYSEVNAGPGDPVTGGWTVESLVRQPSSVILRHSPSGTTAQVIRGNIVEIKPSENG